MTDCSSNYKFNTWKFQAQTWVAHVGYRNCFLHSEQFLYTTCSPHVLQKEELLTKIYLYSFLPQCHNCICSTSISSHFLEFKSYNGGELRNLLCSSLQNISCKSKSWAKTSYFPKNGKFQLNERKITFHDIFVIFVVIYLRSTYYTYH